jgi:Raf kinase inhibitor-like YbhB/YbcL family protein
MRMGIAHDAVKAVGRALGGVHAGAEKLASRKVTTSPPTIVVTSDAFTAGSPLPRTATADGEGVPPPLQWSNVPSDAASIVILCEDPDAPFPEPFVHWSVYGVPGPVTTALTTHVDPSWKEGQNSKLARGFTGAAPPPGHGVHRYHFQVFALDRTIELDAGAGRGALLEQMRGHVLAWGELVGTHERR